MKNAKEPKKAISIIKKYEEPLKGENSTIINLVGKQGELLKKFKDDDEFFGHVISRLVYISFCVKSLY